MLVIKDTLCGPLTAQSLEQQDRNMLTRQLPQSPSPTLSESPTKPFPDIHPSKPKAQPTPAFLGAIGALLTDNPAAWG